MTTESFFFSGNCHDPNPKSDTAALKDCIYHSVDWAWCSMCVPGFAVSDCANCRLSIWKIVSSLVMLTRYNFDPEMSVRIPCISAQFCDLEIIDDWITTAQMERLAHMLLEKHLEKTCSTCFIHNWLSYTHQMLMVQLSFFRRRFAPCSSYHQGCGHCVTSICFSLERKPGHNNTMKQRETWTGPDESLGFNTHPFSHWLDRFCVYIGF